MASISDIDNNWTLVPSQKVTVREPHVDIESTPGFFRMPCVCNTCTQERVATLLRSGCEEEVQDDVDEEEDTIKVVNTQTWSRKKQKKSSPRNYIDRVKKGIREHDIEELFHLIRISKH
jgi:hypothetical protein